jgi:hypothetical protein
MSFQKDLIQYYVDKLNTINSSFPSGHDFIFRTGYLIQKADLKFEYDTYPTYYSKETTQFIPVMVDTIDRPRNIPGKDVSEWTISIQFLLVGESDSDPYFIEQYSALEAFRRDLVDEPIAVIPSGSEKYLTVHSSTTINRSGGVSILNGKKVIPVGIQIFATTSLGLDYGNNVILKIYDSTLSESEWQISQTPTTIVPLEFIISSAKTLESEMEFGDSFATSVPLNRFLDFSVRMNLDTTLALTKTFIDDIAGQVGIEKPYQLEFVFPGKLSELGITSPMTNTTYSYRVLLESGVAVFSLGGITTLDLRFKVKYGE